ncbi:hypothetical protein PENTCL1PPCAC_13054, partial [Pristionchus entomophagus]
VNRVHHFLQSLVYHPVSPQDPLPGESIGEDEEFGAIFFFEFGAASIRHVLHCLCLSRILFPVNRSETMMMLNLAPYQTCHPLP